MPALLPQEAQLLQPSALAQAFGAVLVLQVVIQRAIGKAQPEVLHHLRRLQPTFDEILLRSRRLLQRAVVVIDHDAQQLLIVYRWLEQWRQLGHRRVFRRRACARGGGREIVALQQFQRVRETDALGASHPLDHVSFAVTAETVPLVLHHVDAEAGPRVFVEGAESHEAPAHTPQLDAPRLCESLDGNFLLDSLLHLRRNVGHPGCLLHPPRFQGSCKNRVKRKVKNVRDSN